MLTLTTQLDRLENSLPSVPARVVRLQRVMARSAYEQAVDAVQTLLEATRNVLDTTRISGRTVTGQTRAAGSDLVASASRNAKQVVGQARAQGRRVASSARQEVTEVIDAAIDAVDPAPGSGKPYEQWTKAELLDRAQQLGIEGRTALNKKQLIAALRAA
jgi:cell division septum initiation protein DivIVA